MKLERRLSAIIVQEVIIVASNAVRLLAKNIEEGIIFFSISREFPEGSKPSTSNSATMLLSFQTQSTSQVILGTAIVDILNSRGEYQSCCAVLDSCSQCNSIT